MTDWDFTDLKAIYINCTLKKSPEPSHTQGLIDASSAIMMKHGVTARRFARSTTRSRPASIPT